MAAEEPWKQAKDVGIPAPSGPHAVGCVDLMHRLDGDPEGGLLVTLFYPTARPADAAAQRQMETRHPYAKWIPKKEYLEAIVVLCTVLKEIKSQPGSKLPDMPLPPAIFSYITALNGNFEMLNPKVPAHNCAPLLPPPSPDTSGMSLKPFPVIVVSHGLAGMRMWSSSVCCDLASNGYVVASIEHRDGSACVSHRRVPDEIAGGYADEWLPFLVINPMKEKEFPLRNKQVRQRADDVKRSLDLLGLLNEGARVDNMMDVDFDFSQFKGRIDVSMAAVMGQSYGGATTVQTLSEDPRFSCGISMDAWMVPIHRDLYKAGLQRPLLFINSSDHFQWAENVQRMMKLSQPPDENGISACRVITLRDTNHMSQTDLLFMIPDYKVWWAEYQPAVRDQTVTHGLNMELTHSFLKRHLLQDPDYLKPVPNLDGLEGHSEYLIFGTNLDLSKTEAQGAEGENRVNKS